MNESPVWAMHHAWMLSDQTRLNAFRSAMQSRIEKNNIVADVGSGTGILASYACELTQNTVYALEYFQTLHSLAGKIFARSGYKNIHLIHGRSYDVKFEAIPHVVVSETIGQIGPEENIVEMMADLKHRYPAIATIIPSTLSVYALPIQSVSVRNTTEKLLKSYTSANHHQFTYDEVLDDLKFQLSHLIQFGDLSDAVPCSEEILCQKYILGETRTSAFTKMLNLSDCGAEPDAIHLYFESTLVPGQFLSSRYSSPKTHWGHAYMLKPKNFKEVEFTYVPKTRQFVLKWA